MPAKDEGQSSAAAGGAAEVNPELVRELVAHFRQEKEVLRPLWVRLMTGNRLLEGLTEEEIQSESNGICETYVECLASGRFEAAEAYATAMAERRGSRGMTVEQILRGLLTLRNVYGRSLFERYQRDPDKLAQALDAYERVADKILAITVLAFVEASARVIREQQEAIRELSTPVLQLREGLLILPIVGVLDSVRARQLTEQLLRSIRASRAKVVVIDITGVPNVDSIVANHLVQTVEASRLMGATAIVTGIAPEIARTLVTIGVDLSKLTTVGDLQRGVDAADQLLGYRVITAGPGPSAAAA